MCTVTCINVLFCSCEFSENQKIIANNAFINICGMFKQKKLSEEKTDSFNNYNSCNFRCPTNF